jgi:hypothetical protein
VTGARDRMLRERIAAEALARRPDVWQHDAEQGSAFDWSVACLRAACLTQWLGGDGARFVVPTV